MLIKVACACGCRYSFDVVPVNGMMPVGVTCPKCGLDGTAKADALIALASPRAATAVPLAPMATGVALPGIPLPPDDTGPETNLPAAEVSLPASRTPAVVLPPSRPPAIALPPDSPPFPPPSIIAPSAPPPPPPPPPAGGLKVGRRAAESHAPAAQTSSPAESGASQSASGGLKVKGVAPSQHAPNVAAADSATSAAGERPSESALENPHVRIGYIPKDGPEPSFPRGVLGAFIGTVVGSLIWYTIYYFGDIDFGWLALLPAVASGMLARKMAREDNSWIGWTAVAFTLIAIFGTRYAIATREFDKEMGGVDTDAIFETYDEKMAEAKEAVAAKTDDQIKDFLQNQRRRHFEKFAEKGEKYQPEGISKDEVDEFKEFELSEFQDFVDGKPSRQEYETEIEASKKATTWITRIGTAIAVIISTGIVGIFSLVFALWVAYRTGSG